MKKLSRVCNKGTLWVLSGLLSLLGFSECDRFPGKVEYGTPRADFIVSGKVTDVEDRTLPQIRVVVPRIVQKLDPRAGVIWDNPITTVPIHDTLYTKSDGDFEYKYAGVPTDAVYIYFTLEDPALEPRFETDSIRIDFKFSDLKGGDGHWYNGSAKKGFSIKLRRTLSE